MKEVTLWFGLEEKLRLKLKAVAKLADVPGRKVVLARCDQPPDTIRSLLERVSSANLDS